MATAAELLAGAAEAIPDTEVKDKVIRIDSNLRTMSIPTEFGPLGVESDDDVNKVQFEIPRYYGEVDLSTFEVRINYMNANGDGDIYDVIDLNIVEDNLVFSWLVGRLALAYKGDVKFIVCFKKLNEDFTVGKEFNTTLASLPVLEGLEPSKHLIDVYPDIIERMLRYMETPISSEQVYTAVEDYLKNNPIISEHNLSKEAHEDIRQLILGLTNRLNALANSDDTTLDQLSEIVAYIKSNKSLIDAITTSKVSVSDIVDDLVTNSSNKPLSAAQGVKLKALIDAIVPVTVDSVLSSTSTNPVQNKVILSGLNEKENKGAVRRVQIGDASYAPNASGVVDMSTMTAPDANKLNGKSADQYLTTDKVVNNLATTEAGYVADARMLKYLDERKLNLANAFFGDKSTYTDIAVSDFDTFIDGVTTYGNMMQTAINKAMVQHGDYYFGNLQYVLYSINAEKNYGWLLSISFSGIYFGTRRNASTFTWVKIA